MHSDKIKEWIMGNTPDTNGEYHYINKGQKVLYYWDGQQWNKAAKDRIGRQGYWIERLSKQPNVRCYSNPIEIDL